MLKYKLPISDQTLASWVELFVPERDLFFFSSLDEIANLLPAEILIMPIKEFNNHDAYSTIDFVNSYWLWNISKMANYACILPAWIFPTLDHEKKKQILSIQKQLGRGLIFEAAEITPVYELLQECSKEQTLLEEYSFTVDHVTYTGFQREMWQNLSFEFRKRLMELFSEEFVNEVYELKTEELTYLQEEFPLVGTLMNRFPDKGGANCFAAVLACITNDFRLAQWIAREWIAQETLLLGLQRNGYKVTINTSETVQPKDVLLWRNEHGTLIHGAFYLGKGLAFNTNGQQFFNPWQVLKLEVTMKDWETSPMEVWRKL
jgi:hypothetical protein